MAPQYNKSDSPHSVNDISETGAPEDPNPNPSVHPSTLAVLRDAAKMARLCPNAWVYNLSESDVASIGNAGKAPRGGSENVFERKGLQAAHLLRPFQDLGGRDGAWAKGVRTDRRRGGAPRSTCRGPGNAEQHTGVEPVRPPKVLRWDHDQRRQHSSGFTGTRR